VILIIIGTWSDDRNPANLTPKLLSEAVTIETKHRKNTYTYFYPDERR
jgi:hypothetical protein